MDSTSVLSVSKRLVQRLPDRMNPVLRRQCHRSTAIIEQKFLDLTDIPSVRWPYNLQVAFRRLACRSCWPGTHPAVNTPMHILLGTDGSSHAIAAAVRALELFVPTHILTLVAVGLTPPIAFQGFESGFSGGIASKEEVEAAFRRSEASSRAALASTLSALESAPRPGTIHELVETGEPGDLLCRLASDLKVDVVVVGSRGRGAVKRALLGSVSTYVMHHAACPVLVVPSEPR